MYRRTVASQTYPTEAATYDFDHKTRRRPSHASSARSTREVRPVNLAATSAGESVGRTRTKMCTWPAITSRATICQSFSAAISSSSSFRRSATRPPRTRLRYFGPHTTCKPSDVTPPAERRERASDMTRPADEQGVTLTGEIGASPRAPIHLAAEAASPLGAI